MIKYIRLVVLLVLLGHLCGWIVAGEPSADEQYWLQLVNRFRSNPAAELDWLAEYTVPGSGRQFAQPSSNHPGIASALSFFRVDAGELRDQFNRLSAAPPLAWNERLHDSASYYSGVMIARDEQSHKLDGLNLLDRLNQHGGYDFSGGGSASENIFAFAEDSLYGHAGFVIDWGGTATGIQQPPGHRDSLVSSAYREIGIAIVPEDSAATDIGPLVVTQHLATDLADGPFLVGALFSDDDHDLFYTAGEGLDGFTLDLVHRTTQAVVRSVRGYASGGYRLALDDIPPATYDLHFQSPELDHWINGLNLTGNQNIGADVLDPTPRIDAISRAILARTYKSLFDLNDDRAVNHDDRKHWVEILKQTYFGDANLDGEFNTSDLVAVFQPNQYEDSIADNSIWATGDWDGDLDFTTSDLITAFQAGGYERGPRMAVTAVPEPLGRAGILCFLLIGVISRWHSLPACGRQPKDAHGTL